jgi:chemotaxis response regulator CheB
VSAYRDVQILIASDDGLARESIGEMLRDAGHVVVAEATDGLEAVEKTYSLLPDVVLMDIEMPEVAGLEAAQIIEDMCPTPTVMMVARDSFEPPNGANGLVYVAVPPTARELEKALSSARTRFERNLQEEKA